ncbi:hypothetical protein C8A05DRAFT_15728 [Staphylotrichum tortipilum]|uniref:SH3 domain-containing protein n=1 Tax=Staphylotrichum tortipilum TaxID=2831512 RepID=A0AAN6MJP4_9PEZI|nr:hypothetical protein C8A05DRAFT_15728 [Staphylotrichum longicolle]
MAIDIEELILAPFREVVERGKEAVANADAAAADHDDENSTVKRLDKAGKAVVREGERALKRLQPIWDQQVAKHGDTFRAAMARNDEIEDKRRKLEDFLYDFEDYIELDTFDEDKFTQLQALTKSFALHVLDVMKRLRPDGELVGAPAKVVSVFPPLPPLPPAALLQGAGKSPARSPILNHMPKPPSRGRDPHPQGTEPPPRPQRVPSAVSTASSDGRRRRLTPQGLLRRDTTVSHASSHYSVDTLPPYSSEDMPVVPQVSPHPVQERAIPPQTVDAHHHHVPPAADRRLPSAQRPLPRRGSTPDTLVSHSNQTRHTNEPASQDNEPLEIPVFPISRITAWVSDQATAPTSPRFSARPLTIRESVIPEDRAVTSTPSSPAPASLSNHFDHHHPSHPSRVQGGSRPPSSLETAPPAVPPLTLPPAAAELDSGLIVNEDWKTVVSDGANSGSRALVSVSSREPDCSIGPKSSLYQMKGFCEGAQAFKQGGHLQGVKKVQGYVAGATTYTGKCITCGYAHQYDELAMDIEGDPKANFSSSFIRFRVRFLYKSHLTTSRAPEGYYGCLFCAHTGSVVTEGDATVFATSDALFRHLARHPQPLPAVPDVTVLYGRDFAPDSADAAKLNDFDVHFLEPPVLPPTAGMGLVLEKLPVAVGSRMHLQRHGEKKLTRPEGVSEKGMLQFFVGACIIGVEFPAQWGGKWARGWHDGMLGVFPVKSVELERPRRGETPPLGGMGRRESISTGAGGGGGVVTASVVARWKWEPHDAAEKGWLVFDKGDTITNVAWVERESWCWSGTNKKGQLGVFPRSHVRWDKVKEEVVPLVGSPVARPTTTKGTTAKRGFFGRSKAPVPASSASSMSGASSVVEIVL